MRTFATRVLLAVVVSLLFVAPASATLTEFFSATGELALSVDAAGSNDASHVAQVNKPSATAIVRKAYVMAATIPGGGSIADGTITITQGANSTGITWSSTLVSPMGSQNHLADMTAFVKPIVDAAPAGLIDFSFAETVNTGAIDGEILVVVFDDSSLTSNSTIVLMFGAQAPAGDTFAITLGAPIDPATPGVFLDMGLGITFGFQPSGQFSTVDVNSTRLTSSAGGQDDGLGANGALITVGGIGDTNANPDPFATDSGGPRTDDELYSLLPFINSSTTSINVFTTNPSNNDNIMFAYFHLSGSAVIGEGVLLSPETATNPLGTNHTVTATVLNAQGQPNPNVLVTFTVISGPNAGDTGQATTNASGIATFTYTGDGGAGTDQIQASFVSNSITRTSNTVTKIWSGAGPALSITKVASTDEVDVGQSFAYTVTVRNTGTQSATGVTVTDDIPDGLQLLDADPSQGTCSGTSNVACNLGTLAAGATATVVITVRAVDDGPTDNVAVVDSDQTSPQSTPLGAAGVTLNQATIPIPTATEYGLMLLAAMLAMAGAFAIRMR